MHPVMEIELMRNVKSLMLFLLAVPYIAQRRFWPFALLMALAFTFHTSTIFLFPLFFFCTQTYIEKSLYYPIHPL